MLNAALQIFGRCYDLQVGEGLPYSSVKSFSDGLNVYDHSHQRYRRTTDEQTDRQTTDDSNNQSCCTGYWYWYL